MITAAEPAPRLRAIGLALVPLALLAIAVGLVAAAGDRVTGLAGDPPPAPDAVSFERVRFEQGAIEIVVRNPQPEDLTIAVVTVDDAIVHFTSDGSATLGRLAQRTLHVPYHWVEGDPYLVGVTTSSGIETTTEIPAAVAAVRPAVRSMLGFGLVGLLVGFVPVALGLLWLPGLRRASPRALTGFLAFTCGLLAFLAVEAFAEALSLQATLPAAFHGTGIVLVGVAASTLGLAWVSQRLTRTAGGLALMVAIGIGVHNLGEGLAIGASFALGEAALGTFLILGFMIHNVTEGLGIAAPIASGGETASRWRLLLLAAVAGLPAVPGTWIGGYTTSSVTGVFFFALAAGAALQVVWEISRRVRPRLAADPTLRGPVLSGAVLGLVAMYATGVALG